MVPSHWDWKIHPAGQGLLPCEDIMKLGPFCLLVALGVASPASSQSAAEKVQYLRQGWTDQVREWFYYTPQGSHMIPYPWFMALERPTEPGMFADSENLARYGFLPAEGRSDLNPGGLPIGFAVEPVKEEAAESPQGTGHVPASRPFLGLTCAACHTADLSVGGKLFRVDGAPARLDFDTFYADLASAVTRTAFEEDRFKRFAGKVLGPRAVTDAPALKLELDAFQTRMAGEAAMRRPALASGFGRVDALTQILNSISVRDQGSPVNLRPVLAPTSYPALWLTPRLEFVQWNPLASNPLGRNGGQVLGVFGEVTLNGRQEDRFSSTILLDKLHEMEVWIRELEPPRWEEIGSVNADLVGNGERLFRQHCAECHNAPPYRLTNRDDNVFEKQFIEIGRVDYKKLGVDPVYIESLLHRFVQTNEATKLANERPVIHASEYFSRTVERAIDRAIRDAKITDRGKLDDMMGYRRRRAKTPGAPDEGYKPTSLTDLKASPLAGVWATGPYLHNGSVPTVYEILSPINERRTVFWTGGRELDTERLGYVSDEAPGLFRFDTSLPGNRNTGHLYPSNGLSHEERMAIIEYLKKDSGS
jgi:mono/diheme cytochrome c family protein